MLEYQQEAEKYRSLADEVLQAIREEYITRSGRQAVTTQTAYVLALQYGIVTAAEQRKTVDALRQKLEKNR